MKELIVLLDGLGLKSIKTYIQSGNVIFQFGDINTDKLTTEMAAVINHKYGFTPQVLILSVEELDRALAANPFPEAESEPKSLHIFFLKSQPINPDLKRLNSLKSQSEAFQLLGKVFYLHAPDGSGRSQLASNVEKTLGVATTARNWRSVGKILLLAQEISAR